MRTILASLVLLLGAAPASAECTCLCVGNRSRPACSSNVLVKPICQQICVSTVDKSLRTGGLKGGGIGGGGGAGGLAGGASAAGIDPSALRALGGR